MRRWLHSLAYPCFDCEDCIGMKDYGCYCAYYECTAPSTLPEWWRQWLRAALRVSLRRWLTSG